MRITAEEQLGRFQLLSVDGAIPSLYSYVSIGGKRFDRVMSHNLDQFVPIESAESHINQEIVFYSTVGV